MSNSHGQCSLLDQIILYPVLIVKALSTCRPPWVYLLPIFQSCSYRFPKHPGKPPILCMGMRSYFWTSVSILVKWTIFERYCLEFPLLEASVSCNACQGIHSELQPSTSTWYQARVPSSSVNWSQGKNPLRELRGRTKQRQGGTPDAISPSLDAVLLGEQAWKDRLRAADTGS